MINRIRCLRVLAVVVAMLACAVAAVSAEEPHKLRFLVMSPHTDDAEFAVGGLVVLLVREGHDVTIANMSGGDGIAAKTKKLLGVKTVEWLGFKDMAIDETPENRAKVAKYLDSKRPDVIFAPWPIDGHPDHRGTGCLAIDYVNNRQLSLGEEVRQLPKDYCPQLYFYEVMSGHQTRSFRPDTYVDLPADIVEIKKRAMNAYNDGPYIAAAVKQALTMLSFRGMESGVNAWADMDRGVWAEAFATFPVAKGQRRIQLPHQK